jgi:hypothetical protein
MPAEHLRPAIARLRTQWKKCWGRLDPASGFNRRDLDKTNMAPLTGWAPVGRRLHDKVAYRYWRTITSLAALRCDRMDAPCLVEQPINGQSVIDYVEQALCRPSQPAASAS